jgi:hypothetical protein
MAQNRLNGHKYTNILHGNTLQNLPKLRFLVLKFAIWQPCFRPKYNAFAKVEIVTGLESTPSALALIFEIKVYLFKSLLN